MNTDAILETWFPKTLYIVENLHIDKLKIYRQEILKIVSTKNIRTKENFVDTTYGIDEVDLSKNEIFFELTKDILVHANDYLQILGYPATARILDMWTNVSKKGDYLFPHNHPNSLLSGAFYVSNTNKNDVIEFFDNINNMTRPTPKENSNIFNFQTCTHECAEGKLLIFKSDFLHGCPALQGDEKIVISFNIVI